MNKAPTTLQASGAFGEQLMFFPTPAFSLAWPKKYTLAHRALDMLMDHRMIDHPTFERSTQSWRLGEVIAELRAMGWPIKTIKVPSPTEDCPSRTIALYSLPGSFINQVLAIRKGAKC